VRYDLPDELAVEHRHPAAAQIGLARAEPLALDMRLF
jgi:hypothetical protein